MTIRACRTDLHRNNIYQHFEYYQLKISKRRPETRMTVILVSEYSKLGTTRRRSLVSAPRHKCCEPFELVQHESNRLRHVCFSGLCVLKGLLGRLGTLPPLLLRHIASILRIRPSQNSKLKMRVPMSVSSASSSQNRSEEIDVSLLAHFSALWI